MARRTTSDQALKGHEARNADHLELWQAARRWLDRHQARLVSDLPGLLLDRLQGGDFRERTYQHVIVDEFQDLTPGEQQLVFRLVARAGTSSHWAIHGSRSIGSAATTVWG